MSGFKLLKGRACSWYGLLASQKDAINAVGVVRYMDFLRTVCTYSKAKPTASPPALNGGSSGIFTRLDTFKERHWVTALRDGNFLNLEARRRVQWVVER